MARRVPLAFAVFLLCLAGCRTPRPVPPQAGPPAPPAAPPVAPPAITETPPPPDAGEAGAPTLPPPAAPAEPIRFVKVSPLREGVWLFSSGETGGHTESNGLIVQEQGRVVLIDLPESEETTAKLLEWVQAELRQPISRAILTHADESGLSGTPVLQRRGIPTVALASTCARAAALGRPRPTSLGELAPGGSIRVGSVELFHPGPANGFDQATVWLREARVLFGGSAVKSATATELEQGADLQAWPAAIRRLLQRYPDATVVVPGRGAPGGPELLHHTLRLLAASAR
jgi:metallo-beta-lactamase class B